MSDAREIADLARRLRDLAASRHDDLSVAGEAADALEVLSALEPAEPAGPAALPADLAGLVEQLRELAAGRHDDQPIPDDKRAAIRSILTSIDGIAAEILDADRTMAVEQALARRVKSIQSTATSLVICQDQAARLSMKEAAE